MNEVIVIGGGFAGVEAAWQAARTGARVRLYEMRPVQQTPAHRTDKLGEIVCSNSLKSDEPGTAPYLLKEELRRGGSLVMDVAAETRVPAGAALAVDRHKFAALITERIEAHPNIEVAREEFTKIPDDAVTVIAAPISPTAVSHSQSISPADRSESAIDHPWEFSEPREVRQAGEKSKTKSKGPVFQAAA